jgi:transposase
MEQLHMNRLRDLINRMRAGESERRIARDMDISRTTVRKYRELAEPHGYLRPDHPLPDDATLRSAFGPGPQPRSVTSSVEPYQDVVQRLVDQGVEMTAIFQRLHDNHGYTGSYSAIRRYVHRVNPHTPEAIVRVHTAPGEELQVDFGSVGQLYDTVQGCLRPTYVFVATLG